MSFNTTIVSVERKELCWDKVICEFQYNYCFGGTFARYLIFAIVILFQYNYCFGGTGDIFISSGNSFNVSIQLLFRWNSNLVKYFGLNSEFQYNYCFGGTLIENQFQIFPSLFQYNYCFGGTFIAYLVRSRLIGFNTTIVSVEPNAIRIITFFKSVSIQLLFRWNFIPILFQSISIECFNTTIVSVELKYSL